jgi:hypothetical protein
LKPDVAFLNLFVRSDGIHCRMQQEKAQPLWNRFDKRCSTLIRPFVISTSTTCSWAKAGTLWVRWAVRQTRPARKSSEAYW